MCYTFNWRYSRENQTKINAIMESQSHWRRQAIKKYINLNIADIFKKLKCILYTVVTSTTNKI